MKIICSVNIQYKLLPEDQSLYETFIKGETLYIKRNGLEVTVIDKDSDNILLVEIPGLIRANMLVHELTRIKPI